MPAFGWDSPVASAASSPFVPQVAGGSPGANAAAAADLNAPSQSVVGVSGLENQAALHVRQRVGVWWSWG